MYGCGIPDRNILEEIILETLTLPEAQPIRVGLMEPNILFRECVAHVVHSDAGLLLQWTVSTGAEISAEMGDVDVLVLGAQYPSDVLGEGLALDYWSLRFAQARLLLHASTRDRRSIEMMLKAGLAGYAVRGEVGLTELAGLIGRVGSGEVALCPLTRATLERDVADVTFTKTERRVIRVTYEMGLGYGRGKLAANALGMSLQTYSGYIRTLGQKLGVSSAADVIERCRVMGMLE